MVCCFGRKVKRSKDREVDDTSTLVNFPAGIRKLTIDHGRVVTAPPSPCLVSSFLNGSRSTKRVSQATTYTQPEMETVVRPTARSSLVPGPPSPASSTFSFAPSVVRQSRMEGGNTRRTSIRKPVLEPMAEAPDSVTTASMPITSPVSPRGTSNARPSQETYNSAASSSSPIRKPEPALTSPMSAPRKASLGAISNAALGIGEKHLAELSRTKTAPAGRSPMLRTNTAPASVPKLDPSVRVDSPRPTSAKTSKSADKADRVTEEPELSYETSKRGKERRPRPPPITTSMKKTTSTTIIVPRPAAVLLEAPSPAVSSLTPSTIREKSLPSTPHNPSEAAEDKSRLARQSVFSVTSSQYSPTFSIRPVNQVQMMQASQVQQVATRASATKFPATAKNRLGEIIESPLATAASPKPLFPPDYSMTNASGRGRASIAGVVTDGHKPERPGASPQAGKVRSKSTSAISQPIASPEVPLTSASLNFPPNFPDYSFLPKQDAAAQGRWQRKSSKASTLSEMSSLPEVVPEVPSPRVEVHELDGGSDGPRLYAIKTPNKNTLEVSLKDVGLRGTATVTISELANLADLQRVRKTMQQQRP